MSPHADVDWLRTRLRIFYTVNGQQFSRGIFIPTTPTGARSATGGPRMVEIYDKATILVEDAVPETFVVPSGTVVTDLVRTLVQDAGIADVRIEDSEEVTAAQSSWEPGTSLIEIVNDLLRSINFTAIHPTTSGALRAYPETPAEHRPVTWTLDDGEYTSLLMDDYEDEQDLYRIPNRWIGTSRTDGEEPALISVAVNTDPDDPYSYPSRGRWITRYSEDVEATSQEVLDSIILGNLNAARSVIRTLSITHAWLPLALDDIVRLIDREHGIDIRARVVKIEENLTVPGALMTTTLREVR